MPHLLIFDGDEDLRESVSELGRESGYTVAQAGTIKDAFIQMDMRRPDIFLAGIEGSDEKGMALCKEAVEAGAEVIVLGSRDNTDQAIEALRLGVNDYLAKPIRQEHLRTLLVSIAGRAPPISQSGCKRRSPKRFNSMFGESEPMLAVYRQISRVAPSDMTVFVLGESGTGKELVARAIHDYSERRRKPFLTINCGAISPNLIESEMFGHERGSFTGANKQFKGYFERADGGTLFLDEITEMSPELQVKLLRVLETGRFLRIGGSQELTTDVRVVAATNRQPEQAVTDGQLRQDLYYRLAVFPLELPALRARGDDVILLANLFLDQLNAQNGTHHHFSEEALERLRTHHWPGNVRELRNAVHRACIMTDHEELEATFLSLRTLEPESGESGTVTLQVGDSLADANRELILTTIAQCGGVKEQAAAMLGVTMETLCKRLERYAAAGYRVAGKDDLSGAKKS